MKKIRLTRTMVTEYAYVPEYYPEECSGIEEAAKMDVENSKMDPDIIWGGSTLTSDETTYEIVECEDEPVSTEE